MKGRGGDFDEMIIPSFDIPLSSGCCTISRVTSMISSSMLCAIPRYSVAVA